MRGTDFHWSIKYAATGGGGILSAVVATIAPTEWQFWAAALALILLGYAAIGAAWHLWRTRKGEPAPVCAGSPLRFWMDDQREFWRAPMPGAGDRGKRYEAFIENDAVHDVHDIHVVLHSDDPRIREDIQVPVDEHGLERFSLSPGERVKFVLLDVYRSAVTIWQPPSGGRGVNFGIATFRCFSRDNPPATLRVKISQNEPGGPAKIQALN